MSSLKVSAINLNSGENTKISIAGNDLDLLLSANGVNGVTVDSNGRVGIGTTSPATPFEVTRFGTYAWTPTGSEIGIFGRPGSGNNSVMALVSDAISRFCFSSVTLRDAAYVTHSHTTSLFEIVNTPSNAVISFSTAGIERMRLDNVGRIGINTSTPTSNLHVVGNAFVSSAISDGKGDVRDLIINNQIASYGLVVTDAGKTVSITTGNVFVPNAVFTAGQAVSVYNNSAASITVTQNSSVTMYLAGTATTGNRILAQRGIATVLCVAANTFVISGAGLS